ncbi:MAG: type II secretion system protein [Planctomycetes bacterium]|nr:type II secretion system protein [Planctomycetota bacterium]
MTRTRSTQRRHPRHVRRYRSAFTMVEVLIVVAIIGLLVSLVAVVAGRVRGTAEKTSTKHLMTAIQSGLTAFKADMGYYPPLLTDDLTVPDAANIKNFNERRQMQYWSTLSLVPYLVGIGDLNMDGTPDIKGRGSDPYDDGVEGQGLRDPGVDKSWGGATNAVDRGVYFTNIEQKRGMLTGKTFNPYVELGGEFDVSAGEYHNGDPIEDLYLLQFNDFWERPIRYYTGWQKDLWYEQEEELFVGDMFTEWVATVPADQQANFRAGLRSAPYVLFSEGEDRQSDPDDVNADTNKDNIVEMGT